MRKILKEQTEVELIDPNKFYSLYQIAKHNLFELDNPIMNSRRTRVRKLIATDKMTNDYLEACIVPDNIRAGKKMYAIKGQNIIKWLANRDSEKA